MSPTYCEKHKESFEFCCQSCTIENEREAIGASNNYIGSISRQRDVLDKGYVRLVDHMGSDLSIVRAARVSYNSEPRLDGSDDKLIHYLWKHKHTTPFESCTLTFEVKAPIFVFRQWHRHRTQSYNEVSARYTELADEYYVPEPQAIGQQSKSSKQSRDIEPIIGDVDEYDRRVASLESYISLCEAAYFFYDHLLKVEKWPRELARMVLPLSTYSKMFTTMNLRNLFHFLELRLHPHAQYEIRVYAEAMLELITPLFPVATNAFRENFNG